MRLLVLFKSSVYEYTLNEIETLGTFYQLNFQLNLIMIDTLGTFHQLNYNLEMH